MDSADSHYVLALDLASSTGWALMEDGEIVHSGTVDLNISASYGRPGDRLIRFHNFLSTIEGGPFENVSFASLVNEVVYEDVKTGFHKSQKANKLYFNLQGILEMFIAGLRIPEYKIHAGTIKKEFTGHGHAEKEDIGRQAEKLGWKNGIWQKAKKKDKRTGREVEYMKLVNDDEADAIALLFVHGQTQGISVKFQEEEHDHSANPVTEDCY